MPEQPISPEEVEQIGRNIAFAENLIRALKQIQASLERINAEMERSLVLLGDLDTLMGAHNKDMQSAEQWRVMSRVLATGEEGYGDDPGTQEIIQEACDRLNAAYPGIHHWPVEY